MIKYIQNLYYQASDKTICRFQRVKVNLVFIFLTCPVSQKITKKTNKHKMARWSKSYMKLVVRLSKIFSKKLRHTVLLAQKS